MGANHTPAPWLARKPERILGNKNTQTYIHAKDVSVALILDGERDANARLIAAAPDLLAILKRYVAEVPLGHQPHMLAHEAEAAIVKAEGRA